MPFINVYETNRSFGGPEEGGWWYDTGDAVKSIPMTTYRGARRALRLVDRIVARLNDGRYKPSSVLCQGYYAARIERGPAKSYPKERPRYE